MKRLDGLSEKIFLDRYARKDADAGRAKPGDLVLVLMKDDAKFPVKEVGEVVHRNGNKVQVRLRDGEIKETTVEKLMLPIERTPDQMWDRLAEAIASVEPTPAKVVEWERKFRSILDDWKLVPGGRIAAGAGASEELTLFNCYVVPSPQDSRGGIMKTLGDMTEIMARGGGVGMNLSSLRPRRAVVAGVNGSSSGSVSWGGLFSYTTGLIEQGGCFGPNERIATNRGCIPASELADRMDRGETFMAETHLGSRRITHSFRNGVKPLFRVTTAKGYQVDVTAEHKMGILRNGQLTTVPLHELSTGSETLILLQGESNDVEYMPDRIVSIEPVGDNETFDFEVEDVHMLCGNGFYTSNSRRGALMLMINDWHPDVMEFITVKENMGQVTNANLSVCVSNSFMDAVKHDREWELVFPDTKEEGYDELWSGDLDAWRRLGKRVVTYRKLRAREIWHSIIESAWKSAEPGVVFMERYNEMSNSWYFNPIASTNPCFHPDTRIASEFGLITISELYQRAAESPFQIVTDNRLVERARIVNGRTYETSGVSVRSGTVVYSGFKKTIKVSLANGMELKVTPEHRIYTDRGWQEARNLKREEWVYIQSGEGLFVDKDDLGAEWGMFLGWLVGDGWLSKRGDIGMVFGKEDSEIIPKMIEAGKKFSGAEAKLFERKNGTMQLYWWRKAFRERLLKLGIKAVPAPLKAVPECIFASTRETTAAFLQALFSSDGTVYDKDEMHRTVRLASSSLQLLRDVQLLLLNFGIHGLIYLRRKSNQAKFTYETVEGERREYKSHPSYEIILSGNNIVAFKEQIGFKFISRKQEALERIARPSRKGEKFKSRVIEIAEAEETDVYDIYEPVTNSLIAGGMVVHNCGEQGLPGWGVCNLSAVNLSRFYDAAKLDVDWRELGKVTRWSVRFLDNVIDKTPYHFQENEANQKLERRIGLGTMGLAELMIKLGIQYGSEESLVFLDKLYGFMAKEAYLASSQLAAEKGAFPAFDAVKYVQSGFMKQLIAAYPEVGEAVARHGIRNVTVITQAPTGSTGTMVGTSTGIEPYFAFQYFRQSRLGFDEQLVPIAQQWKDANPGSELPDYFVTAMDLSAEDHIRVQAAIQRWVDSSISKTANCPADFTVEDTKRLYELAYELGCKGVTIYRDGSRDVQVLSAAPQEAGKEEEKALASSATSKAATAESAQHVSEYAAEPELSSTTDSSAGAAGLDKQYKRRPQVLRGATYKLNTPFGMAYITINDLNGSPAEIFLNVGKAGSDVFAMAEALGRVCSLFLRYGDHGNKVKLLVKHLKGIGGTGAIGFGVNRVDSIADAVAKALEMHVGSDTSESRQTALAEHGTAAALEPELTPSAGEQLSFSDREDAPDLCPSCGSAALLNVEGCKTCASCGFSKCN